MGTFLLKYFLCMAGVTGLVVLFNILTLLLREISLTWREMKAKQGEVSRMEWISDCDIQYNPEDGRYYIIYLDDGGMELAAYNVTRRSFVQIHYGQEFSEEDVTFIALVTNPWSEMKNDTDGNT